MLAPLASVGDIAQRAGVTTSTVRYYERRGLLPADARRGGQRRYSDASLRQLVFIGMLKDTGLTLDDIEGIINAATNDEWKAIGWRRLHSLDEEIARLECARSYLRAALECPYDHPMTQCSAMGAEIDRRLRKAAQRTR